MNKYERNIYQIHFFDKYGSKVPPIMFASGYIQAETIAEDVKDEECSTSSYVIMHVLKNSLDKGKY